MAERIRVTLRWIQILDKMEPFFKERGEFRFTSRVASDSTGSVQETRFPKEGHYEISDHPAWNKLNLDKVIFDGEVESALTVEIMGEELDTLSANDQLDHYRREFAGSPADWIGIYGPGDDMGPEGRPPSPNDPENMPKWRVNYRIEKA